MSSSSRMIKRRRPRWHFGVTAALLLGAIAFAFLLAWQQPRYGAEPLSATLPSPILVEPSGDSTQLHDKVDTALAELGLWPELIAKKRRDISGVEFCTVDVRVPKDLPMATVNLALTRLVKSEGGTCLSRGRGNPGAGAHGMRVRLAADDPVPPPPGTAPGAPCRGYRGRARKLRQGSPGRVGSPSASLPSARN